MDLRDIFRKTDCYKKAKEFDSSEEAEAYFFNDEKPFCLFREKNDIKAEEALKGKEDE